MGWGVCVCGGGSVYHVAILFSAFDYLKAETIKRNRFQKLVMASQKLEAEINEQNQISEIKFQSQVKS